MTDDDILIAIEERRFLLAKRDLERKIKKSPTRSFYQAANAYCLLGMGEMIKASKEAKIVMESIPSDPKTLKLLKNIFEQIGEGREALKVYENAASKYPSLDLLLPWFEDSFMSFDTNMIVLAAKALFSYSKTSPKCIKAFCLGELIWTAEKASEEDDNCLLAAEALNIYNGRKDNQEVYLISKLYFEASQFSKAAEVLEAYPRETLELKLLYLETLYRDSNWQKLHHESIRLIFDQNFDDYDTWKLLIRSSYELDMAKESIRSRITDNSRNSLLANIYLDEVYGDDNLESIQNYYRSFEAKPCCIPDLYTFTIPQKFSNYLTQRRTEFLKQEKFSNEDIPIFTNLEIYSSLLNDVLLGLELNLSVSQFPDLYPLFVIRSLGHSATSAEILSHILRLEKLAIAYPENFMIRSWLLNLYTASGLPTLAHEIYEDLKIKMVQHDALSYKLLLEPTEKSLGHLINVYRFYLTSEAEVKLFLKKAKTMSLYTKVKDLYLFGKRLANSLSKHILIIQILKISRLLSNQNYSYFFNQLAANKWKVFGDNFEVFDNRDFESDFNLGIGRMFTGVFDAEKKQTKEYIQICYAKELLISLSDSLEVEKILKLFEKWLGQTRYRNSLTPSEQHTFKIYLSIFKIAKGPMSKDRGGQLNFLVKNLDLKRLLHILLADVDPLSKKYVTVLTDLVELEKVSRQLLLREARLRPVLSDFRVELKVYLGENNRLVAFQEKIESLRSLGLDADFLRNQLNRLENSIRRSKIALC